MAYTLDLSSSVAKLNRAKTHVKQLRREIEKAGRPDPDSIPLTRKYSRKERAVIVRVQRTIKIADHWPLVVGDAIHNLRGALDHLAWQLAIKSLNGAIPTEEQARRIQFPIVEKPGHSWAKGKNKFLEFMLQADVDRLKKYQPFMNTKPGIHGLAVLSRASNTDKHRAIHLVQVIPDNVFFANPKDRYVDCIPDARPGPDRTLTNMLLTFRARPQAKDEIFRFFVTPTGSKPDVDVELKITAFVVFGEGWKLLHTLDVCAKGVGAILKDFGA